MQLNVLKKVCDHPRLFSRRCCAELDLESSFNEMAEDSNGDAVSIDVDPQLLLEESGKMEALILLLENLKDNGHRTLVFSMSRKILDIIEKILKLRNWRISRLDGTVTTKGDERQRRVETFQNDSGIPLMLLTTQVGGVGLTITAADRVVIYDPNWNPASDAQAVDRAYRIGQTKPVVVYRFITCGTIEEKIYRRQIFKDSITRQVTTKGGNDENPYRYFSENELRGLFVLDDPKMSQTQKRLEEVHAVERGLPRDVEFLLSLKNLVFDVSDHLLMFQGEIEEESPDHAEDLPDLGIERRVKEARDRIGEESRRVEEESKRTGSYRSPYARLDKKKVARGKSDHLDQNFRPSRAKPKDVAKVVSAEKVERKKAEPGPANQEEADYQGIGYVDIMELIEQFPEIFGLVHPNENFIIYVSRQEASFVKELDRKKFIPENLVPNIKRILIIKPEGISFPILEKLNFKVALPYLTLGYFTMESFMKELNSSVADTFNIFEESGPKKFSLIQEGEQQHSLPKRQYKVPSPEQRLAQRPSLPNIPEDAATIENRYKQQTLDDRHFDKYFEVVVSDVTSHGLFYIQIVGIKRTGTLEALMHKFEETYTLPRGTEYVVPHNCFTRFMPCVALYCGDSHRAKMLGFPNKYYVEVFYVDYSTKRCVKREQIGLIKKTFVHFNSQAIRALLAGLKPVDSLDLWNLDSGYRLLELTKERELQCKAITYDYGKGISVELHVDDDNGYDLCVNDVLVDEGFAEPNDNELEELRSLYNSENSEHQLETYENPTAENVPFVQQPIINHYSTLEEETPGFDKSILEKLSGKVLREKQASDSLDCKTRSPEPETEEAEIPFVARVPFQHPSLSSQPTANVQPNIGHATPNEPITQIVEPEASHNTTAQQNLTNPTMNAINGDSQEASSCVTSRRYVKKVKLPMNCHGHLMNYNSKLLLTSGDISHFIYGSNVFLKMFHRLIKFQDLEMITIARNECPALFDELTQYRVRGFEDASTQNCCVVPLVLLEICIEALEKVHTNHEELKLVLQDALDNFDPLDPCWMQTKDDTSKEQNEIETPEFIQEHFLKLSAERKGIMKRLFEEDYSLETHLEYQSVIEKFQYYHELCQTIESAQSEKLLKSIEELSLKNEAYSNISNERHRNVRSVQAAAPISAIQTPVSSTQVRNMISAATNNNFTGIPLSANEANPNIFYPNLLSQPNIIFPNMQFISNTGSSVSKRNIVQ